MTIETTSLRATPAAARQVRPRRRSVLASAGLHGALGTASLIAVFPVCWVLVVSFKPDAEAVEATPALFRDATADNYRDVLSGSHGPFLTWFGNSVLIAALTTGLGVLLSATAAYAVSRFRFPGHRWLLLSLHLALGFRVETEHGVVALSGDTARSDVVATLAADADLLVHEVMDPAHYRDIGYSAELLDFLASAHTAPGRGRPGGRGRGRGPDRRRAQGAGRAAHPEGRGRGYSACYRPV